MTWVTYAGLGIIAMMLYLFGVITGLLIGRWVDAPIEERRDVHG